MNRMWTQVPDRTVRATFRTATCGTQCSGPSPAQVTVASQHRHELWPQRASQRAVWNDPQATPYVSIESVTKKFGDFVAVNDVSLKIYKRRAVLPARRLGLRQDHAAAHAGRVRGADHRVDLHRRRGHDRHPAVRAAGQHDVPVVRAVPAHDGRAERRLRPEAGRPCRSARSADARRPTCSSS